MSRFSRRTSIAASRIVQHIDRGGWLGASWPLYVKPPKGASLRKAVVLAVLRASRRGYSLQREAERNFEMEVGDDW